MCGILLAACRLAPVAERGSYCQLVVCRLLTAGASLVAEPGLWSPQASVVAAHGLSSCGPRAYFPQGMWHLPRPGVDLVSPTLQDSFLTTGPPGKPPVYVRTLLCVPLEVGCAHTTKYLSASSLFSTQMHPCFIYGSALSYLLMIDLGSIPHL